MHLVRWRCLLWLHPVLSNRACCLLKSATSWTMGRTKASLFGKVWRVLHTQRQIWNCKHAFWGFGPLSMSHLIQLLPGPKANSSERKAAMSAGQQFIKDKGYSKKTQVELTESTSLAEKALFRMYRIRLITVIKKHEVKHWLNLTLSYFLQRSKSFLQELRQLCSNSSSVTGGTKTRLQVPVKPTPWTA